jgi:hypothetical protein
MSWIDFSQRYYSQWNPSTATQNFHPIPLISQRLAFIYQQKKSSLSLQSLAATFFPLDGDTSSTLVTENDSGETLCEIISGALQGRRTPRLKQACRLLADQDGKKQKNGKRYLSATTFSFQRNDDGFMLNSQRVGFFRDSAMIELTIRYPH